MTKHSYNFIMDIVSRENIKLSNLESDLMEKLKNTDVNIEDMNINELASTFYISNSTITRFSQKLGFNGFVELKYGLQNDKKQFHYITQDKYSSILNSITVIDDKITGFIKDLDLFNKIVIIGIGTSGLLANEFIYKLNELGLYKTDYAKEPYKIDLMAKSLKKNDLLICISLSGENTNILKGAGLARENGASIFSIVGYRNTPLEKLSDYCIKTPSYSKHDYNISKAFPILIYIDIICEIYSNK